MTQSFYPKRHMAPQVSKSGHSWQNDGQNYVFDKREGKWRTWALGNPDWTPDSGFPETSWIAYSGPSIDRMKPEGVFINKNMALAKSFWSGSCWVDEHNRLGRGHNSAYYYVSGMDPDVQGITLLVAKKLGEVPYSLGLTVPNYVIPSNWIDAGKDFRDCRVFWDDENDCLVMAATIGSRYVFLKSTNGTVWEPLSYIDGPGPLVECPNVIDLKTFTADGKYRGIQKVILGAVQGQYEGGTDSNECCAYWIGDWDGKTFTPKGDKAFPLDYGPDSYATVAGFKGTEKYMGFWMGNWAYSLLPSPYKGFQNIQAFPRNVWIQPDSTGTDRVFSFPVEPHALRHKIHLGNQIVAPSKPLVTSKAKFSDCYRVDMAIGKIHDWPDEIKIEMKAGESEGKKYSTTLTINKDGSIVFDRSNSGYYPNYPNTAPAEWTKTYAIPASRHLNSSDYMTLTILFDTSSVEVFVNGGEASLTGLVFPPEGCEAFGVTSTSPVSITTSVSEY